MTFKAVLIGCGAMARGWLKAINETPALRGRLEIVGLVDLDRATAESLANDFALEGAEIGTDLAAMLDATEPDFLIDIVVPAARRQVVTTALEHGCHVLSEKPMATSLGDAQALIEAANKAGRVHAITQNRRHVEGAQRVRRFVADGGLGELTGVHCDFFLAPHFGGFREEMHNILLLDMAIHTFDAARFMSGQEPVGVYCHETNPRGSWYAHGAAANAIFEMTNDVAFTYRGSWCADGFRTSWESAWRFIGTKGSLVWDGADKLLAETVTSIDGFFSETTNPEVPALAGGSFIEGHAGVIADFLDSLETGRDPLTVNTDNIKSLAMVFGAIESAAGRKRIAIANQDYVS